MLRSPLNVVTLVLVAWFIIAFLLMPSLTLLGHTFIVDGRLSFRVVDRILASSKAVASLRNSLILAIALSVTVNVTGIFIVLVTRYFDIKGSRVLSVGFATSMIYGGITLVAGYKMIYGPTGVITKTLRSFWPSLDPTWFSGAFAVIFVMTFATTGNHMLFLSSAIGKLDYQTVEASRLMGASAWTTLRRVVLPTLAPMIFAITTLTFLGGLNALMAPLILGGERFQTISPMILTFSQSPGSRDLAAGLAIVLGGATIVLLTLLNRLERRGQYFSVSKVPSAIHKQKIDNPVASICVHAAAWLLWLVYILPPVLIIVFSFTQSSAIQTGRLSLDALTLDNYTYAVTNSAGYRPLVVSLVYSTLAALIVVVLITLAARTAHKFHNVLTTVMEYLLHIPWILPSILIALGLVLTYSRPHPIVGGVVLTGTTLLLLVGYVAEKIPFTFRLMKASFSGINASLEEAAGMMGARAGYTLRRVIVPLIAPTALAVSGLAFISLLSEFDMSIFLSHPLLQPLGPFIKQATVGETGRDATGLVFVYTVLLMVVNALVVWGVYGDHTRLTQRLSQRRKAHS
ncbi:ABC transporter permease [Actinomyces faecalis]|uniref:ABC transporter permease n=1 Tax=Actinomyces faecalis TaxID=2722820 RepID=UPI0015522C7C|nr:iron ABC transporter permease [Actinomyces faecalis]